MEGRSLSSDGQFSVNLLDILRKERKRKKKKKRRGLLSCGFQLLWFCFVNRSETIWRLQIVLLLFNIRQAKHRTCKLIKKRTLVIVWLKSFFFRVQKEISQRAQPRGTRSRFYESSPIYSTYQALNLPASPAIHMTYLYLIPWLIYPILSFPYQD